MWISKDMHGNIELWDYKPKLEQFSGCFYGETGDKYWFGKKRKIAHSLKRGETKKVLSIKVEVK